jgi:hypothetical protein
MKNKDLKQLKKAYKARLKILTNKEFLGDLGASVLVFVEQLKYLRDTVIVDSTDAPIESVELLEPFTEFDEQPIKQEESDDFEEEALAALIIAVAEFEAYQNSVDMTQKDFHFNNFWEFVKTNIDGWLTLNDTI